MPREIAFDLWPALWVGAPVAAALLALPARALLRRGIGARQTAGLLFLRAAAYAILLTLLARPVWVESDERRTRKAVVVLLDRSESMSLAEEGRIRYARAADLARARLAPALEKAGFEVRGMLFADAAEPAVPERWGAARPDGPRTNLAGAIAQAVAAAAPPPLAVVALTDGAANDNAANRAALTALVETRTAFVGVGFGHDAGVASLTLQRVSGPPVAPPRQEFKLEAQLQAVSPGEIPAFDLVLLRDGRFREKRTVSPGKGSRLWTEGFRVSEEAEGLHEYTVQLVPPSGPGLVTVNTQASAHVRVSEEKEFRVLYVQGALTWDFKFIGRALRADPTIRVTGLSRTSKHSVFRQNVESAGELLEGFPEGVAQMAPYRVLVLSDLKPADLTPPQQEVVARFCGELGGGVLLLGGPATFDGSWQGSRLEQLLPVAFDTSPGVLLERPFHLKLTDEAQRHAVFQVTDGGGRADAWGALPTFTQYGRVLSAKPGATVWAVHDEDRGPQGPRILMASQPYGAGLSAVVAIQNFWRWRLAKDADPREFDRFWQQFLRFLGQSGRQDVAIQFPDQELLPGADVRALLERQPRPEAASGGVAPSGSYAVRVLGPDRGSLLDQKVELAPLRPVEFSFRAETAGAYTVLVRDGRDVQVASRILEIRDVDREMLRTGRDMENLRQWARVSQGLALSEEECGDGADLVARIRERIEDLRSARRLRVPAGLGGGVMVALLGLLCAEWLLRRRWGLT